jgi:hypothetical protein
MSGGLVRLKKKRNDTFSIATRCDLACRVLITCAPATRYSVLSLEAFSPISHKIDFGSHMENWTNVEPGILEAENCAAVRGFPEN